MITLIELNGFKTFQDFKLELSPFQVIVGPNGAGKSNLFDALHLLSRLVDTDLRSAFQELRGDAIELFTTFPNGRSVDKMTMAVEILVDRNIQDSWGAQAELKYTRMRYELEISRRADEQKLERLYVTHESLRAIPRSDDSWCKRHGLSTQNKWLPKLTGGRPSFISTDAADSGQSTINLHQDGHGGRKSSVAEKIERTVLSGVTNTEFPHAFAAREEIRNWRFLQLNPEVLRFPSPMLASPIISPEGNNLATALARMQAEDPWSLNDVSSDLANLVPGILKIEVEKDQARNQYIIKATTQDQSSFSSRVLSDGTLRMLALATLKNDPRYHGVLCFEEPENGVHPFRLKNVAHLLRGLATDFEDNSQVDSPLRQLLVNTHSPAFISQPDIRETLLFAYMVTRVGPRDSEIPPQRITRIVQVIKPNTQLGAQTVPISKEEETYTIEQIKKYLTSDYLDEARDVLVEG
ncbi:MAG: AAA family ATPase [Ktedonobacteraceae bacterium]